jgi:hypothetical protein
MIRAGRRDIWQARIGIFGTTVEVELFIDALIRIGLLALVLAVGVDEQMDTGWRILENGFLWRF